MKELLVFIGTERNYLLFFLTFKIINFTDRDVSILFMNIPTLQEVLYGTYYTNEEDLQL